MGEKKSGADLIAAERRRQMEAEGWTAEHDDEHARGALAAAAACYAMHDADDGDAQHWYFDGVPEHWPWDEAQWNPSEDPIRNLVKAGALIAAEIDRLQRRGHE